MSANPRYIEVYTKVKKLIRDGEIKVNEFLPTEAELEKRYGVSRTTIRKAVQNLVAEGYVEVKQGSGTKVVDFRSTQELNYVTSISETLARKGYDVKTKSMYIDIVNASKTTSEMLNIPMGSQVYHVQRVILADSIPTVILENFISVDKTPNIDQKYHEIKSLYAYIEEKYGFHIDSSKDTISAKSADFVESQMLDIRPGAALITLRRVTYSDGKALSYDKSTIRADKYQFEITLRGRKR